MSFVNLLHRPSNHLEMQRFVVERLNDRQFG